MSGTMQEMIREYLLGGFKPYRLIVATEDGWGPSELVGGFDTRTEADDAARAIEAECDRLIREGFALSSDGSVRPYFWIYKGTTQVHAGNAM